MAKRVIVPAVDLEFKETVRRLLGVKPPPRKPKRPPKKKAAPKGS